MRFVPTLAVVAVFAGPAAAQQMASPFVGHWVGSERCSFGEGQIVLDIAQEPEGGVSTTMKVSGVGTLHDATFNGDTITMTWSNFLSHVTLTGKFVSLQRVEGRYHESLTGEDCPWFAENQTPRAGMALPDAAAAPSQTEPPAPSGSAPPNVPVTLAANLPASRPSSQLDLWKAHAEQDREKLRTHLAADSKTRAIAQFCQFAPDQAACGARIAHAFEFLTTSPFATLAVASKNKSASLPPMEPAAGLPSFYDVYQVYMFLTHDSSP